MWSACILLNFLEPPVVAKMLGDMRFCWYPGIQKAEKLKGYSTGPQVSRAVAGDPRCHSF